MILSHDLVVCQPQNYYDIVKIYAKYGIVWE